MLEVELEAMNADPWRAREVDVDTIIDPYDGIVRELESPPIITRCVQ